MTEPDGSTTVQAYDRAPSGSPVDGPRGVLSEAFPVLGALLNAPNGNRAALPSAAGTASSPRLPAAAGSAPAAPSAAGDADTAGDLIQEAFPVLGVLMSAPRYRAASAISANASLALTELRSQLVAGNATAQASLQLIDTALAALAANDTSSLTEAAARNATEYVRLRQQVEALQAAAAKLRATVNATAAEAAAVIAEDRKAVDALLSEIASDSLLFSRRAAGTAAGKLLQTRGANALPASGALK